MCLEVTDHRPRNTAMIASLLGGCVIMLQPLAVPAAKAVEVLSARELASHCALPSSEHDVVDVIVADLAALANNKDNDEPAMEVNYTALQQHYPGGES